MATCSALPRATCISGKDNRITADVQNIAHARATHAPQHLHTLSVLPRQAYNCGNLLRVSSQGRRRWLFVLLQGGQTN